MCIYCYIFFTCRKSLFKGIHNFVHLNLSVALSSALLVFVSGIEGAVDNNVSVSSYLKPCNIIDTRNSAIFIDADLVHIKFSSYTVISSNSVIHLC